MLEEHIDIISIDKLNLIKVIINKVIEKHWTHNRNIPKMNINIVLFKNQLKIYE